MNQLLSDIKEISDQIVSARVGADALYENEEMSLNDEQTTAIGEVVDILNAAKEKLDKFRRLVDV